MNRKHLFVVCTRLQSTWSWKQRPLDSGIVYGKDKRSSENVRSRITFVGRDYNWEQELPTFRALDGWIKDLWTQVSCTSKRKVIWGKYPKITFVSRNHICSLSLERLMAVSKTFGPRYHIRPRLKKKIACKIFFVYRNTNNWITFWAEFI